MRPLILLILVILLLIGLLYFFSTQANEVPTRPIEVEVNQGADAR